MSDSIIDTFAATIGKAEVAEAKYDGQVGVVAVGRVIMDVREARELLDAIRRLEREAEDGQELRRQEVARFAAAGARAVVTA